MSKTIIVAADEPIGCPKYGHGFPLFDGISRQAIERHAEEHERPLAAEKKKDGLQREYESRGSSAA